MGDSVTVYAPAKINLFLEVKELLDNGYHNLESVMQSVTLYDTLVFEKTGFGIEFICDDKELSNNKNLVYRAAEAFYEETGIKPEIKIELKKKIPVCAGLGGGSSDAAATLKALNDIYGKPLSFDKLLKLGKKLGADVPFCLMRGLCFVRGIGEVLERIGELPLCKIVLAKGNLSVKTSLAFKALDGKKNRVLKSPDKMLEAIKEKSIKRIANLMYNAFEINGEFDKRIKRILLNNGAEAALVSGSGPTVFGVFSDEKKADNAYKELKNNGYESFICEPERIK